MRGKQLRNSLFLLALLVGVGVSLAPYRPVEPATSPPAEHQRHAKGHVSHDISQHGGADTATHAPRELSEAPPTSPSPLPSTSHHHNPRHSPHCILCIVGAGLLVLGVTLTFQAARGFVLFYKPRLRARPDTFTLYRSRAPPRFLVTDRTAFKKSFTS